MGKIKTVVYVCAICGNKSSYSVTEFSLCERCLVMIQWLQDLGVNSTFFCRNFLWLKELSEFFAKTDDYGTFEGLVKQGKVVKADLTTTLLYNKD